LIGTFGLFGFGVCGVTTPGGDELEGGIVPGVVEGGVVPGDGVEGGKVPGVDVAGGAVPGDVVEGGAVPGDDEEGGKVPGDDVEGGAVPGDVPDAPPGGAACAPAARPNVATRMIDFNLAISLPFFSPYLSIYPL